MSRHASVNSPVSAIFSKENIRKEQMARKPIEEQGFEEKRWPFVLAMPVMWLLTIWVMAKKSVYKLFGSQPEINTLWFDGLGLSPREVKRNATSWRALHEIYNYSFVRRRSIRNWVSNFWEGMLNCQAVRNRYKLVKQEIGRAALQLGGDEEVRIISLACGSAQPVIEAVADLKAKGITASVVLIDIDQSALDYAVTLASRHGVSSQIRVVRANVCKVVRVARDFKPHIVEMVGLLDYFEKDSAVRLIAKIKELLVPDGVFITCNVAPNLEQRFLEWVVDWKMVYRTASQLAEVAEKAGFEKVQLIAEPLRIHNLAICRKSA